MAWFRAGGGNGIPTQLKDNMDAVLNKKFGTSTTYPPGEWPDDVNLLGVLEEKTTTKSAIAHITDGADRVPVKNWQVTLDASLTGYSSVDVVHCGKNLIGDIQQGGIDATTGAETSANTRVRTGFIEVLSNTTYAVAVNSDNSNLVVFHVIEYDENKTYISASGKNIATATQTTGATTKYIRITSRNTTNANITPTDLSKWQCEQGNQATTYAPYSAETHTVNLGRTIYGGSVDVVQGTGTDENGNDFTFTPITPTPETKIGVNNFWADNGDSQLTYRSSGTETIIAPDLTTKSITANGTYNASSDNADGYSQVTVNVTPPAVQTVQYDNLSFDGDLYIELPNNLVSPNHSYFIDFTTETQADATGEHAIFGIKNDYYSNFVGIRYNNLRYQVGQNGGSTNISNSWEELTGRHTFLYDGAGTVYFDTDAHTYSYNPSNTTGDNIPIVIGSATATPRTGKTWKGLIHRFTIRNTSTNTLVADYVPAAKQSGQTIVATGLLDLVSNNFVTTPTCSVSNDE